MGEKPTDLEVQLIRAIKGTGLAQRELARLCGVNQGALSRFLSTNPKDRRTFSLATADRLCKTLGLELVQTRKPRLKKRTRR